MMTGFHKQSLTALAVALFAGLAPVSGFAQLLDDVDAEVVSADKGAELRIHFNAPVHYLRHTPSGNEASDRVEIFFRVISTDGLVESAVDETRKIASPIPGVPRFSILVPRYDSPLTNDGRVILKFEKPTNFKVNPGIDGRSIVLILPALQSQSAPQALTPPVPVEPAPLLPEIQPGMAEPSVLDVEAKALFTKAKAGLDGNNLDVAIETFNQLLNMPPNTYTRPAQELIGVARERNGDFSKAMAEYNLFTQLFPTGADADRVRARLAALPEAMARAAPSAPYKSAAQGGTAASAAQGGVQRIRPETPPETRIYGSWATYFYWGATDTKTTSPGPANTDPTTSAFNLVDGRSWMNSLDFNVRYRSTKWDNKLVFRDTDSLDARTDPGSSRNRLSSAYAEIKERPSDWLVRVGRQSVGQYSITGIMNRFDGILGGWGITPKFRVNMAFGQNSINEAKPILAGLLGRHTTTYNYSNWKQPFKAVSADLGPFLDNFLSGSVYAITQDTDGTLSRRAVGGELRLFKPKFNAYSLVDYDTYFKALNIFMLQANYMPGNGLNYNMLLDKRRSPMLQITNALQTQPGITSIGDLINASANGIDGVRQNALAVSQFTDSASLGVSWQFNPKWQVGGDIHFSHSEGTPAMQSVIDLTTIAAVPATGWDKSYGVNLTGNNLWLGNDVGVFGLSYLDSQTFYGLSPSVSYRWSLNKWTFDTSLRLFQQRMSSTSSSTGSTSLRWSPTFRVSYRLRDNFNIDGEGGIEYSKDNNASWSTTTNTTRKYLSLGLRWDY